MPNRIRRYNGTSWVTVYDEANFSSLSFSTIAVSGQSSVVADTTGDTLTLAAGTGIGITTDAGTDTITVATNGVATNTGNTLVLRNQFGGFSAGTITATSFSGSGASLTSLNASQLTTGTVPSDRLSGSYGSVTGVGTLGTLTVSGTSTFNGTSFLVPTDGSSVTLGASATSGDRIRLHRSGSNGYVDFSGNLHFRSNGDSNDVVIQSNGVTVIDKHAHNYMGVAVQATAQSIANNTATPLRFDGTDEYDYGDMHSTATTTMGDGHPINTRVTIPFAGVWQFWSMWNAAESVNAGRYLEIRRYNSSGTLQQAWRNGMDSGDTGSWVCPLVTASFLCNAGDYVQAWAYHDTGAARLTLIDNTNKIYCKMGWTMLRATP